MRLMHHCGALGDRIEVRATDHDQLIARFRYQELDRFVAEGKLSVADLFDHSDTGRAALCRRLALLACAQACRHGMTCLAFDCPHHPASQQVTPSASGIARKPSA
ncbi:MULTISPECIES: hypothetical protein [unclassified Guyparkeria]|uniref:hypothetical protein n=1 Tax=unclassified Guyparkeria TaxID=2626246 RepID=UPI0007339375|nr:MULTISPECIES: hypothetical protein [unclassified Guyparkeria]KTG16812.1 hypothetical protein AUR63_01740 [Guyparkeria sp. XI15]OAE85846.1 hypothetical protein AWR35_01740 [Guyparkeria sp. WRN-7]